MRIVSLLLFALSLLFLLLPAAVPVQSATYEFSMILNFDDPGARQLETAARIVLDDVNHISSALVSQHGASLNLSVNWLMPRDPSAPLQDLFTTLQSTTDRTVFAFEGAPRTRRLPAFILANTSIPFFSFDRNIIDVAPLSFTIDYLPEVWTNSTFGLLSSLGISRVTVAYSSGSQLSAEDFVRSARSRGVRVDHDFQLSDSDAAMIADLRLSRQFGSVYVVVFAGPNDTHRLMSVSTKNDLQFEYLWVTSEASATAVQVFQEVYTQDPIKREMLSGFLILTVNTTSEYDAFFDRARLLHPETFSIRFSEIDERVPYFVDAVRACAESIISMLEAGRDPLDSSDFFNYLTLESIQGRPMTGRLNILSSGLRVGVLAVQNWAIEPAPMGDAVIEPTISVAGLCNLNVCSVPDALKAIQWSTSRRLAEAGGWTHPEQDESSVLKIGVALSNSLAQSREWKAALEWAVSLANNEILSFYQIRVDFLNVPSSPPAISRVIKDYEIVSRPVAVVGPLFSFTARTLASSLQAESIPLITPAASEVSLSNSFYFNYVSRVGETDTEVAVATLSTMREFRWLTFAALSSTDDIPSIDEFSRLLPSDMRLVSRASFTLNGASVADASSISAAIDVIKASPARVIVYSSNPSSIILTLRIAKEKGVFGSTSPYVWIFDKQVNFVNLSHDALGGGLTREDFVGVFRVAPNARPLQRTEKDCFSRLQTFLRVNANISSNPTSSALDFAPDDFTPRWVDSILLTAHGIERLFLSSGASARNGSLLNQHIRQVAFRGCTGPVVINPNGDRGNSALVTSSFNGTHWVPISTFTVATQETSFFRSKTEVKFSPIFRGQIPLDKFGVPFSSSSGLAVVLTTALVQVVLLGTLALVIGYRSNVLIHASSPIFLCFILVGMVVALSSNYVWLGDQTQASCIAQKFLLYLGFALAFGSLLVKNWRIYVLFNDSSMQIIKITNTQLAGYVAIVCSGFLFILILWAFIDAPQPSPSHISGFWCASSSPAWEIVINFLAFLGLAAGAVIAVLTRKIPALYKEARSIGLSIYCLIVLLVGGGTLTYAIQSAIQASNAVVIASFFLIISFSSVFAILFIPKFYLIFFNPEKISQLFVTRTGKTTGSGTSSGAARLSHGPMSHRSSIESGGRGHESNKIVYKSQTRSQSATNADESDSSTESSTGSSV